MTSTCQACAAASDAHLCPACTDQLRDTLKRLPGLIDDLATAAARQARLGDTHTPPVKVPDEWRAANAYEAGLPAALRSPLGRTALPAHPLPVSFAAAALHRQALAGVADWLTHIEPDSPLEGDQRTAVIIVRNRAVAVRRWTLEPTVEQRGAWLARQAQHIRQSPVAGEIHARALDLVATIEAAVDRPAPDVFAYRCERAEIAVDEHDQALTPRVTLCDAPLHAAPGAETVECPKCGTEWDVAERRAVMADRAADKLGTVLEVSRFLRTLTVKVGGEEVPLDVTVDKIDGWLRRGRITGHGRSSRGRLVKIGEVRAYAEQLAQRAATRG